MAETYTTQYTNAFISSPRGNNYGFGARFRTLDFDLVVAANGTAADTIGLVKIPPKCTIDMYRSWFYFSGWTSGATLSIGWEAYKDEDGATVNANATGLLNVVSMTADGAWSHGMLVVATPDDSNPVTPRKVFNNRGMVKIYATIGTQAPGAADVLQGSFGILTP